RVVNTVRHMELPEFEQMKRTDILSSIVNAQAINEAVSKSIEVFQIYTALLVGSLYISFAFSPFFGLLLLGARLFQSFVQGIIKKNIFFLVQEQQQEEKKMFAVFQDYLYGFKELKFNLKKREDIFNNFLLPRIKSGKKKRIKSRRYGAELILFGILVHLLMMVCCTSLPMSLAPEEISKIIIFLCFAMQNDMLVNASIQNIVAGNAALMELQRLFPLNSLKKTDEDICISPQSSIDRFRSMTIDSLVFAYSESDKKIQNFSINIEKFNIKSGEIIFIIGGNGSGKSTFMKVLTGLYPFDSGTVMINSHSASITDCRDLFSAIFTDFQLFDRLYGVTEPVDQERVRELLRMTELEEKTRYEGSKFNTRNLSAGQKKRLALVVTMMEDRQIFMFDEWAADQDPHFRRSFYEIILPLLKKQGKTVIAVTHDDQYFHVADKVVRMESGRIAEQWHPARKKTSQFFYSSVCRFPKKNDKDISQYAKYKRKKRQNCCYLLRIRKGHFASTSTNTYLSTL
ncbi:MAG: ATP-binding cassette domain-containing protein, partial [Candidatus Electrothrix sp. LOE1_4_5]|nr:ATP-binding cassette domain-containing protein [Candidatus Electrothrix gigas]